MEDITDRVHLIDGSELELLEDCKAIAYTLIDSIEYGDFDRLFSLVEDYGKKTTIRYHCMMEQENNGGKFEIDEMKKDIKTLIAKVDRALSRLGIS